jgi:hypothetical protein
MLRDSSKHNQADWLEKRLHEMDCKEATIKAVRDIKRIISGMGSLSDIHLDMKKDNKVNDEQYNVIYLDLLKKLDFEISSYLKRIESN